MKLIGIDYGRRRIGLAATDETGSVVRGLTTIDRKTTTTATLAILSLIARENAEGIVIGIPLDSSDNETSMSREIRVFAADLENRSRLPVYFIDESLSSKRAGELMRFRTKKARRDKSSIDRLAACLILEAYLEEHAPAFFTSEGK